MKMRKGVYTDGSNTFYCIYRTHSIECSNFHCTGPVFHDSCFIAYRYVFDGFSAKDIRRRQFIHTHGHTLFHTGRKHNGGRRCFKSFGQFCRNAYWKAYRWPGLGFHCCMHILRSNIRFCTCYYCGDRSRYGGAYGEEGLQQGICCGNGCGIWHNRSFDTAKHNHGALWRNSRSVNWKTVSCGYHSGSFDVLDSYGRGIRDFQKKRIRRRCSGSLKEIFLSFKSSILALLMPLIILGGIYGEIFTPTEAAVVAVVHGVIIGLFAYKELDFKKILEILQNSGKSTAVILYLVATAHIFSYILASEQIPQQLAQLMLSVSSNPLMIQFMIMIALLFAGTFLDNAVAIVLLTPIFYPITVQVGIDPVFFGVLMVFALAIGQVTPPVGLCLFVACNISKVSIEKLSKAVIPFLVALIVLLVVLNLIPDVILYIPRHAVF